MQNSNLRPLGHEPSELPLLQPAICAAYLHRQTASQSLSIQIILNKQINNYYEYLCKNIENFGDTIGLEPIFHDDKNGII